MKKLITYVSKSLFIVALALCVINAYCADTKWGVKSHFATLLQAKLQSDRIAKDFFDQDWNVKDINRNASTYATALYNAIKDKGLFEASTDAQAIQLFDTLFKLDGTKIIWKNTLTDQNLKDQLAYIATTIQEFITHQQGLTPENLVKPCCQSDERLKIFNTWVKVDPANNTVSIQNLTNDDATINQALVDIAAAINTIEDGAYYDRVLPANDQRGISVDPKNIVTNLANLELRIAALEGQKQTFCCSDEECALNCPNATTMTGTTCTINPECKPHPSSIVDLKAGNRTRAENIIKRAIALFPLFSEADLDEKTNTADVPAGNICLGCSKRETVTKSSTNDGTDEIKYSILIDDEDSELQQYAQPPEKFSILDGYISTLIDSGDPLQRHIIHYAAEGCAHNQADWLTYIIEHGAQDQVNTSRADGNTPLHIVAQQAQKQSCDPTVIKAMINLLVNKGAETTIDNGLDTTTSPNAGTPADSALFTRYYSGNTAAQDALEKLTGTKSTKKNNQFMPLKPNDFIPKTFFEAAITGDYKTVENQVNILKKANQLQLINMPDYLDIWQRTALHYAASGCKNGHKDIVKLLVENGANVNAHSSKYYYLDEQGIKAVSGFDTPLHAASGAALIAENQDESCDDKAISTIMQILLDHGADPHAQNAEGRRAFDISALILTQNTEASIVLMNYALKPCTTLAEKIQKKDYAGITLALISECLKSLKFIEGTHVNYDEKGDPIYYYLKAYDAQNTDAYKLYFLETMVSQLEGIYGLFKPLVNNCSGPYAFTAQEKALNNLGLDFIKVMQKSDSSAQDLPGLLSQNMSTECRKINCALRFLRVVANIVQPDTALTDISSDQKTTE